MDKLELKAIGVVHSPYKKKSESPRQGRKKISEIEIFDEYRRGLKDIDEFSHLHVLYWLHKSKGYSLEVKTPWDTTLHGLFTTRSPRRPNPIGHSIVQLLEKRENVLRVRGLDAIEGTPVIDLKPYIPRIGSKPDASMGWFENKFRKKKS